MKYLLFFFIVLINKVSGDNECKFESNYFLDLEHVVKCLKTVPV